MTVSTPGSNLGRHVFGVAALAFGFITLAWHDYNGWHQPRYLVYAAALIFGGAGIQFRRTAKTGAAVLGAVYLVFALLGKPGTDGTFSAIWFVRAPLVRIVIASALHHVTQRGNARQCMIAGNGERMVVACPHFPCAGAGAWEPGTPLRRIGAGILRTYRAERKELGTACGGSSSGFLGGFRGGGSLAAALGFWRSRRRLTDQLGRHDTGNEQLGSVIVKIDRGTLLIGCGNNSQAVCFVLDCLTFCHHLHIVLLDHTLLR